MTRQEAREIVREAAESGAVYIALSGCDECRHPSCQRKRDEAAEIREALAVLEQKPPEGVPEVVYLYADVCHHLGISKDIKAYVASPTPNKHYRYIYRFDGIVEAGEDGSVGE